MKRNILLFLMFVLMNASLAMAEWTGDTIAPQKANGYYLISKPEEYVWLGGNHLQIGDKAKLVADVIFGKDKNTVDYKYPVKPLSSPNLNLDFNGFSVYSAYSVGAPFILGTSSDGQRSFVKDASFKNFEIVADLSSFTGDTISTINLKNGESTGNVILEGVINVYGKRDSVTIMGGGFQNGVLKNRIHIVLNGEVKRINIFGVGDYGLLGIKDTSLIHEAVNYGDIKVVSPKATSVHIHGMVDFSLSNSFYKMSNYGNITIDGGIYSTVSGLSNVLNVTGTVAPEAYNEGDITVKQYTRYREFSVGGLFASVKGDSVHFARALNLGNISYEGEECFDFTDDDNESYLGGCIGAAWTKVDNLINEGNLNIHSCSGAGYQTYVGGVIGDSWNVSNVFNGGDIYASVKLDSCTEYCGSSGFFEVGGIAGEGYVIKHVVNKGNLEGVNVGQMGGIVGFLLDNNVSLSMNLGNVSGKCERSCDMGGIYGYVLNTCDDDIFACSYSSVVMNNLANYGNVNGELTVSGVNGGVNVSGIGGTVNILGAVTVKFENSFNVGTVKKLEDSVWVNAEPLTEHTCNLCYYDWEVFYESDSKPKNALYPGNALTTEYMRSEQFVDELNAYNAASADSKVWTLSESYPYPIIADLEKWMNFTANPKEEKNPILENRPKVASAFVFKTEKLNILVSGARIGTPYAVLDLLGKSISRGRISSQNQRIPVANAGTYIVKVGKSSRLIVVKK